ncbi:MAG: hypothetical protein LBM76_00455 [Mycoplasmataceae bacterium]|nr:hypothetical protein [Mycoplasmataceae bacterium]
MAQTKKIKVEEFENLDFLEKVSENNTGEKVKVHNKVVWIRNIIIIETLCVGIFFGVILSVVLEWLGTR